MRYIHSIYSSSSVSMARDRCVKTESWDLTETLKCRKEKCNTVKRFKVMAECFTEKNRKWFVVEIEGLAEPCVWCR